MVRKSGGVSLEDGCDGRLWGRRRGTGTHGNRWGWSVWESLVGSGRPEDPGGPVASWYVLGYESRYVRSTGPPP